MRDTHDTGFGQMLRRMRLDVGLTQDALAERAGMSARGIQELERGGRQPQYDTVRRLAVALHLGAEEGAAFVAAGPPAPRRRGSHVPPHPVHRVPPTNLPGHLTSFVGREREVAEVRRLLGSARLLTLTGPPGTGKTRLAIEAAGGVRVLDAYRDGVYFVALAPIADPDLVVAAIAQALRVREVGGRPLLDVLTASLRHKQALLVLDNFEQVVTAGHYVAAMLLACPNVRVLVTSRVLLRVQGERAFPVPPLATPEKRDSLLAERMVGYDAVRLFVERAQARSPDFALTAKHAPAVAELCRRLDGLPLAIELAAARSLLLPPQAMLARLAAHGHADLLAAGPRDLPERQQSLRATLDWSHELLTSGEQALFRRLGVFVGGCTLEAAEAVVGVRGWGLGAGERTIPYPIPNPQSPTPNPRDTVLEGIASLMENSLLQQEAVDGHARFRMLETIREYALERLEESGEGADVRARHAAHVLALAEHTEPGAQGPDQVAWLQQWNAEHHNVREALRWSLHAPDAAQVGLRIFGSLERFWIVRGHFTEARDWFAKLLARAMPAMAHATAPATDTQPRVWAKALDAAGRLEFLQGDITGAAAHYERFLALARAWGDPKGTAQALKGLGGMLLRLGDDMRAEPLLHESLRLSREQDDRPGIAYALYWLARLARAQGKRGKAVALFQESLALTEELGDTWLHAATMRLLGDALRDQDDRLGAQRLYERSLGLGRALGSPQLIANALDGLGDLALDADDIGTAKARYEESIALRRELGDVVTARRTLVGLARLAALQGRAVLALRLAGAVEALRDRSGEPPQASEQRMLDGVRVLAQHALPSRVPDAAWEVSPALTLEQAIAEALDEE